MTLEDADVLFGRLALGRGALTRADALALAREVEAAASHGRRESLPAAAVRLGYLAPRAADELRGALEGGALVCRPGCGRRVPLVGLRAAEALACVECGGVLYLARPGDLGPERTGKGTFLELAAAPASLDPAAPLAGAEAPRAAADDGDGGRTFLELDTPVPLPLPPSSGEGDAERTVELADPLAASPIAAALPAGDALGETWRSEPPREPEFAPFSIGGELEILAPVGRGGMGAVYRARRADGALVAVKVLSHLTGAHSEALARFRREVSLAHALDHPGIVRVHEAGVVPDGAEAGKPFFTMDYVQGRDLARWREEQPRAHGEQVRLIAAVCDAMDFAHGRGVVHRDLKPANVLVALQDDAPLVCDFGLARWRAATQNLTHTGEILGTPSYMPPEQALGDQRRIGPPTDVYALGALLYFLLTGRPPFTGPSSFAIIDKVVNQPPEPPSAHGEAVPAQLEAIVLKALAKDPVARFHTAGELARTLRATGAA